MSKKQTTRLEASAPITLTEMFPEHAKYFSIRKIKAGWIAEILYMDNDELVREQISEPGGRMHAISSLKIALSRYWDYLYQDNVA